MTTFQFDKVFMKNYFCPDFQVVLLTVTSASKAQLVGNYRDTHTVLHISPLQQSVERFVSIPASDTLPFSITVIHLSLVAYVP